MRNKILLVAGLAIGLATPYCATAQDEIAAEIQRTSNPPVINGVGDDDAWQSATPHTTEEFFELEALLEGPEDLGITWKALWDDANLYVLVELMDDEIINDDSCDWQDDSVEIYIDAQNLDVADYRPDMNPEIPAYQFTAIAGETFEDGACGLIFDESTSVFTHGINSYDGDDAITQYPQGADTSMSVIADANNWSFEVAFPWDALESSPEEIMAEGAMGFGVAVNDDDDLDGRDTQMMWATESADLWMRSDTFPSVALVGSSAAPGDFDGDGDLDLADIEALSQAVRDMSTDSQFDLNSDGAVDAADRSEWINVLKNTYFGDADLNGEFNSGDFVQVFQGGKFETNATADWSEGDWNGDTQFNSGDFVLAFQGGGFEAGPRPAVAAVPEPTSISLLLLGGAMLLRRRRG